MSARTFLLVFAAMLSGCAVRNGVPSATPMPRDAAVTVFRADRETAWKEFRLGGGLNVVVANPRLAQAFAWRVTTGSISSSPTVLGTTVLVASNDDHVYAIDAATGALRWRYRAENEVMSQPDYAGNLIYVGIGNANTTAYYPPHMSLVGSGVNKLEAIDPATGIEQWFGGLDGTGMPTAAIVGPNVISADGAGTILALDRRTGAFRWDNEFATTFSMSSLLNGGDGRLYVAGRFQNAVYAVSATNGALQWEHRFETFAGAVGDDPLAATQRALIGVYLQPTAAGPYGMAVTYGSRARQHVYAIDKRTGRLLWDTLLAADAGAVPPYNEAAIALVYDGRIYVGSAVAPLVTALDLRGRVLWSLRTDGSVKGGLVAYDGVIYFGDHAGRLWAVDARTGDPIGSIATDMSFNSGSPIIVNGSLVDGGTNDVIALPLVAIRDSHDIAGITRLSWWQQIGNFVVSLIPRRDPHREAAYYASPPP